MCVDHVDADEVGIALTEEKMGINVAEPNDVRESGIPEKKSTGSQMNRPLEELIGLIITIRCGIFLTMATI